MSKRLRTNLWYRTLTALFGVWFVLATMDAGSTRLCPMHNGPMPSAEHMAAMADAGHHHHADAQSHDATDGGMSHGGMSHDGSHTGGHACTCISTCCAATVPMPAVATVVEFLETLNDAPALLSEPAASPRVSKIDFVLPFATAPPMHLHA